MSLTELQLKHAEITGAIYQIADTKGLFVQVMPSGSKRWRFRYQFNGRRNMLSFGLYPDVTIREARSRRDKALAQIKDGKDPSIERQREKALAVSDNFGEIAEEYPASPPLELLLLNGFFAALWLVSAWLMRKAAREQTSAGAPLS